MMEVYIFISRCYCLPQLVCCLFHQYFIFLSFFLPFFPPFFQAPLLPSLFPAFLASYLFSFLSLFIFFSLFFSFIIPLFLCLHLKMRASIELDTASRRWANNKADRHKSRTRNSMSHIAKKSKVRQTDRPTDRRTDTVAYRVACT